MTTVFIDGSHGTTGLQIHERLKQRTDIELLEVSYEDRHSMEQRKKLLNESDIAFLCLPDEAAKESVAMIENDHTVIIDTSTAHRTSPGWLYGLPELLAPSEGYEGMKRIANPGCHATGFITLAAPLVKAGMIDSSTVLHCVSLTGYSGGGKKMIADYEADSRDPLLDAPRMYGLTQNHKHLKEMKAVCALDSEPIFCPIVADYFSGMETIITLSKEDVRGSIEEIKDVYRKTYTGNLIHFREESSEGAYLSAVGMAGRDDLELFVAGNDERFTLVSRFDNLGKGACGAAIQNMNRVMGIPEETGLRIGG